MSAPECPLCSVETTIATHVRDMGDDRRDAWLWGVVLGWDSEDPTASAMTEMMARHRWTPEAVDRLRRLHAAWDANHRAVCAKAAEGRP